MNENYGENAHARDSRYQMSKDWQPQAHRQNVFWDYLLYLLSVADEILIISKSNVAIFPVSLSLGLLLYTLLILKKITIFVLI